MTNEQYRALCERMQQLASDADIEAAHGKADDILCGVLDKLGYTEIVDLYNSIEKWYG